MIRWTRSRALALVAATATAATMAVGVVSGTAGADDAPLVQTAEWRPFPADTAGHGHIAIDDAAQVGYAFSGTSDNGVWTRVQAIDLRNGRPLTGVAPTRGAAARSPMVVDIKRHVLIYAETYAPNRTGVVASHLVGIARVGKDVKEVFRVPSPVGQYRIAGLAFDDTGSDLFVVGTLDGTGQAVVSGSSVIEVQRVSVDALMAGNGTPRWPEAFALPRATCQALIQTSQPVAVLAAGDAIWLGCRGASTSVTGPAGQAARGAASAIVKVSGLGATRAASPAVRPYPTSGNYAIAGESLADPRTRRFVVVESSGYIGLRVFDADHGRYVGRINAGQQNLFGAVLDRRSSRVYFSSHDPGVGLGFGDLAAQVPTQGERLPDPYAAYIGRGTPRRLSFDSVNRRLFVPLRRQGTDGRNVESILVMTDRSDPYTAPAPMDHSTGSIDAVDRAGVTESSIAATARAYGADYQLIGGTANLLQNASGVDTRGIARPGTRHLRQAYVRSASLTGDGAVAYATTAEEDATTDADRHAVTAPSPAPSGATAGSQFAPVAECSDYGTGKTQGAAPGAKVTCDLHGELVTAAADFQGDDAVLITVPAAQQQAPVRAPVQVGRATTEVREQRGANRGALTTTITTTAQNVVIGGVASFGRVTQVVTLTAHGRSGSAKVTRTWDIANVVVNGQTVCGAQCSPAAVQREVNDALRGRGGIDFPLPAILAAKKGTYAELTQDPWYHAERVLDYDKANDDHVVPVMSIQLWMDSTSKSRLVVDVAGASGTASYRVYPAGSDSDGDGDFSGGDGDGDGVTVGPVPKPTITISDPISPADPGKPGAPAPRAAGQQQQGFAGTVAERLGLTLRSIADALPLLMIWALLGVPAYLSARRRLLLELPMLTRDEELT